MQVPTPFRKFRRGSSDPIRLERPERGLAELVRGYPSRAHRLGFGDRTFPTSCRAHRRERWKGLICDAIGRSARSHPLLYDTYQLFGLKRFREIVVHASFQAALTFAEKGVSGHGDDDWLLAIDFPDLAASFEPVHAGHLAIHENDIVGLFPVRGKRFAAVRHKVDFEPCTLQNELPYPLIDCIVFCHQDSNRLFDG